MEPRELLKNYDTGKLNVATIGSHSALDICSGAKKYGLGTIAICTPGREQTYAKHYRTRQKNGRQVGCVDHTIMLESFKQLAEEKTISLLREKNALFIPHKTLSAHLSQAQVESMAVPFFGNRFLLAAEERAGTSKDQSYLFKKAGIPIPEKFSSPTQIDRLAIVKATDETRGYYERAFFICSTPEEYGQKSGELLAKGIVSQAGLQKAVVEEFVVGAQVNFNFFHSPLDGETELLGTDFRRQTNLDGLLRIPARQQLELQETGFRDTTVEVGHVASTVRESLLEQSFDAAEKFVKVCAQEYSPGIIGPFALQGAIVQKNGREQFVVFDASLRSPGSPGTRFTPYSHYLYGEGISTGERIAQEIVRATKEGTLEKIVT